MSILRRIMGETPREQVIRLVLFYGAFIATWAVILLIGR